MRRRSFYLDASALVKLVVREPETEALVSAMGPDPALISSALARVEVRRAVLRGSPHMESRRQMDDVLIRTNLVRIDDNVLERASTLRPPTLRSLDAIHLATALSVSPEVLGLITYDSSLASAARDVGLTVLAPT